MALYQDVRHLAPMTQSIVSVFLRLPPRYSRQFDWHIDALSSLGEVVVAQSFAGGSSGPLNTSPFLLGSSDLSLHPTRVS